MLESLYITKSKIRQDLLALFFSNPSQKYYLRELERMLGYSAGSIRRELLKYKKDGLFTTQKRGNSLYYSVNTKHPLYQELKAIIFKTIGIEGSLKNMLSSIQSILYAFVYGSFAAQEETSISDIDLMIIGDPDISKLNENIRRLEEKLKRQINPTIYSLQEYKDRKRSKSAFIQNLLEKPKIMLIGDEHDL